MVRVRKLALKKLLLHGEKQVVKTDLFDPIPPKDECPICRVPHRIREIESLYMACCGKIICFGCIHNCKMHGLKDQCSFCNQPWFVGNKEYHERLEKRAKTNDPTALLLLAHRYQSGKVVQQDRLKAQKLFIRSAELGNASAYFSIAIEERRSDVAKYIGFLQISAKMGDAKARYELALKEARDKNWDSYIKHCKIAAKAGFQRALDELMDLYGSIIKNAHTEPKITKEELTEVLRAFQDSIENTKGQSRDAAARILENLMIFSHILR